MNIIGLISYQTVTYRRRETAMFIGRSSELEILNEYLYRDGNQLMILYGQEGIGKTALLNEFMYDVVDTVYLEALQLSEREQLYQWAEKLQERNVKLSEYPDYAELFQAISEITGKIEDKKVVIFDEFQNLCKNSTAFFDALFDFREKADQETYIILCSSTTEWIENSLIRKMGIRAKSITGFFKVKELNFKEFVNYFSEFSFEECIQGYSIFGGVPALWQLLNPKYSLKENLIHYVLNPNHKLYSFGTELVERPLRETNVYNTILCALSKGKKKLNDLYAHTEFSRAKISVYLKNLMEIGVVEKAYSFDTEGRNNTLKGIYDICNSYVAFTYQFLFGKKQELLKLGAQKYYEEMIEPYLGEFTSVFFAQLCRDYLESQNDDGRLPINCQMTGKWIGKVGNIDFVGRDDKGKTILALCNWQKPMMRFEDYEWLLFCAKQAKLPADYIYLFSAGTFDEELKLLQNSRKNIKLINLDTL